MKDEEALARILFCAHYRSRRLAKREIREAGGHGSAAELNSLFRAIEHSPDRARIEHLAEELGQAWLAAESAPTAADIPAAQGSGHDAWIIGEGAESRRMYIIHWGLDAAFIAEVFDDLDDAPIETEAYKLDDGQFLGNVIWLSKPPAERMRLDLFEIAREQLRAYDAMQERDLEDF